MNRRGAYFSLNSTVSGNTSSLLISTGIHSKEGIVNPNKILLADLKASIVKL